MADKDKDKDKDEDKDEIGPVDRGIIRILDLVFIHKSSDGAVTVLNIADFDGDGQLDLEVFDGASSGLLDDDDIAKAGGVIQANDAG